MDRRTDRPTKDTLLLASLRTLSRWSSLGERIPRLRCRRYRRMRRVRTCPVSGSSFSEAILALRSSLLVVHRVARPLEALVYAPAEAGSAAQTVPQEGRARLAALGDDLVQLVLQAEAASG